MEKIYSEYIAELYDLTLNNGIRNVTFQVTNDCCCACSYCYQIDKHKEYMSLETGKKIVDLLFQMYIENNSETPINASTKGLIFDFIGGEPLMNISTIVGICDYFVEKCLQNNHPWLQYWRISMISNGTYYFNSEVQSFLQKYKDFLSFSITIDGPQEIHDTCRKYPNGEGNFKDAYKAFKYHKEHYGIPGTKITFSPENLNYAPKIINFFKEENVYDLVASFAFEPEWTLQNATQTYYILKEIADNMLSSKQYFNLSLFSENSYKPLESGSPKTFCGATEYMIAFDPSGNIYPCIRFMESSLGEKQKPIILGDSIKGFCSTEDTKDLRKQLVQTSRETQWPQECFKCPISMGCPQCSGFDYLKFGTVNSKSLNHCYIYKACSLANIYYWNNYYKKFYLTKRLHMFLPKEEALKIIPEAEYLMLYELQNKKEG